MKGKKEAKPKSENTAVVEDNFGKISTKGDLKNFLMGIRDKMTDNVAAPVYAMSAMNHLLGMSEIYALLDNENKEIARDIWLRLKQSGLQLRNPPLLFGAEDGVMPPTAP